MGGREKGVFMGSGRTLDTGAYVSALKELTEAGRQVGMTVWGGSMSPFLVHGRDRILFSAPDGPLRRGDMVFFRRENGKYVMHRICKVKPEGFYLAGDAQTVLEGPVSRRQIFARVTGAVRKGKPIDGRDFWWRFFAGIWPALRPVRPAILGIYGLFRK